MSKFYHYLNATLVGAIVLAGFAACQDEDLDVSEATLKAKAYDNAFIKQFGQPDPNQSWDFFTQSLESLQRGSAGTRASGAGWSTTPRNRQPDYITTALVNNYSNLLPESKNNYTLGQTQYKLQSTGSGNFTISAIWYGGAFETTTSYTFHFYMHFLDNNNVEQRVELFSRQLGGFGNPGLSTDIHLDAGIQFWFELEYRQNNNPVHRFYSIGTTIEQYNYNNYSYRYNAAEGFPYSYTTFRYKDIDYYHIYNGPSQLLYSETQYGDNEIKRFMVVGFEDAWEDLNYLDFDYNDVVLYIDGDLPIPEAKRFYAEDLASYDWDFNDVVVDCEYKRNVLRAVGGTLPIYVRFRHPTLGAHLSVNKYNYIDSTDPTSLNANMGGGDVELHEWMYEQNIAAGNTPTKSLKDEQGRYRPINVDAEDGLKLNPVVLLQWKTPLSLDELKKIGNSPQDVTIFVNDMSNSTTGMVNLDEDITGIHYTNPNGYNLCPAVVMGTVSTRWMKERVLITKGYPTFYEGNNPSSDQDLANIWCNYDVKPQYLFIP